MDPDTYVTELVETMKRAHETARKNLKTSSKRMKCAYDLRVLLRPYKEGDIVYEPVHEISNNVVCATSKA